MTVRAPHLLAILGGTLLVVGLFLGFMPISTGGVSCGSAFKSSNAAGVADYSQALAGYGDTGHVASCRDSRSSRKTIAWALLIPGALLGLAGGGILLREYGDAQAAITKPTTDPTA